jgi:hypothetical protein
VWVDGVLEQLGSYSSDQQNYDNMLNLVNQRLAEPTSMTLQMFAEQSGDQTFNITGIFGVEPDGETTTFRAHLVDVLFDHPTNADGRYNNCVMGGVDLGEFTLSPGQSTTISHEITFSDTSWANQDNIRVVMFAQDVKTFAPSDVYQSAILSWPFPGKPGCHADLNGDELVNVDDLFMVINAWGPCDWCPEDINGDGFVNVDDLFEVINAWGPCPTGACCIWDGTCQDTSWIDCALIGHSEWFEGEECGVFDCPELPTGACCIGKDCIGTYTLYECTMAGGIWFEGEDCIDYVCKLQYCDSSSAMCPYEYIEHVACGTIDNTSGCGMYEDYTDLSTDMTRGQAMEIIIESPGYRENDLTSVWVDWNQDGDFEDADEEFAFGDPGGNITIGDITPPVDAMLGETRMRITVQWKGPIDPCGKFTFGEVEDYTVNVVPARRE